MKSLCDNWSFTKDPTEGFFTGEAPESSAAYAAVRLPHTVAESPLHCADPGDYTGIYGYRREIGIEDVSKRYFVQFDGAAHAMELFVNGKKAGEHFCGYTAFRKEITEYVHEGRNLVAVRLDTTERPDVPPFGFVMDYLGYGGLYREAWLDVKEKSFIEDVYIRADHHGGLTAEVTVDGEGEVKLTVLDGGKPIHTFYGAKPDIQRMPEGSFEAWSPENPKLYTLRTELISDGRIIDVREDRFGFRTAAFNAAGMELNGKPYFMRGLDRHQCWPYIGYAAPASLQYEDARIMKEELCLNAVRTSHYPQSQSFIDACDELGLLVFTEIPGWQHIGDEAWKQRSTENVREMVMQYRNHPSIVLWGVRINESPDDDEFYVRTNALAHELDPSRATSGVRCITKSSLLEDVYAYNDFSHHGDNPGCLPKRKVTPDMNAALLISEHNGHMFPTKSFDTSAKRQEHALRHAKVLGAAYASHEHAGCFGWCMFDYPTHEQFGSGDRVCYHGVLDQFRNPKLAAALYSSQGDEKPFLEVGSSMEIGDHPASVLGEVYIFTNADEVRLYKNDEFVSVLRPERGGLPHPPIRMDDRVGELLEKHEGVSGRKAKLLRESLNAAAIYGMGGMPLKYKLKMARLMLFHGMKYSEGVRLYGEYVGNWGSKTPRWRFDAVKDGQVVASAVRAPSSDLRLDVRVSKTALCEGASYDMAAVRVRVLDGNGAVASYAQLPVRFELSGVAQLVGPSVVTAEGGMCGTFVRTLGRQGKAKLTVSALNAEPVSIEFTVE
ncbi:MAG: glycoside hydrolase family 2 protein [Clostridia bacterium]|nr:glycoside hydrolase family 2 protein [Clostridia bacterium]